MGDTILILAFVVIVIGGIGSIRGAFLAALLIGLVDTLGRSFAVDILRLVMAPSAGAHGRAGDRLDADLSPDGAGAVLPARRPVPGTGALMPRAASTARSVDSAPARRLRRDCCPILLFLGARRRSARGGVRGAGLHARPVHARDDLRHRRARARPPGRLRRAGVVRPRRLHRARRLCGRHSRRPRHPRRADRAAGRARSSRPLFAVVDRRRLPAHQAASISS